MYVLNSIYLDDLTCYRRKYYADKKLCNSNCLRTINYRYKHRFICSIINKLNIKCITHLQKTYNF